MKLNFFKMQAQGNDYIYFDLLNNAPLSLDFSELAIKLSKRNTGIGGDGLVILQPDPETDAFMRIFNADGSEATSCGSALRCVTSYLSRSLHKNKIQINTLSGIKHGTVLKNKMIRVNLGRPSFLKKKIKTGTLDGSLVQLGNNHFVVQTDSLPKIKELAKYYTICQNDKNCSNSNLEFYQIKSPQEIEIKVWEKGSGPTLACGTGAGAAVYTGLSSGLLNSPVKVNMPGGTVVVEFEYPDIFLLGEVEFVFQGDIVI